MNFFVASVCLFVVVVVLVGGGGSTAVMLLLLFQSEETEHRRLNTLCFCVEVSFSHEYMDHFFHKFSFFSYFFFCTERKECVTPSE